MSCWESDSAPEHIGDNDILTTRPHTWPESFNSLRIFPLRPRQGGLCHNGSYEINLNFKNLDKKGALAKTILIFLKDFKHSLSIPKNFETLVQIKFLINLDRYFVILPALT